MECESQRGVGMGGGGGGMQVEKLENLQYFDQITAQHWSLKYTVAGTVNMDVRQFNPLTVNFNSFCHHLFNPLSGSTIPLMIKILWC